MKTVIDDHYTHYFCKQHHEHDFLKHICADPDDGFPGVGWSVTYFCFPGSSEVNFDKLISLNFPVGGSGLRHPLESRIRHMQLQKNSKYNTYIVVYRASMLSIHEHKNIFTKIYTNKS